MCAAISLLYVGADSDAVAARAERFESDYGLSVTTAIGIDDAKQQLAAADIDCVVSEFRLPDADAFDLLSQLNATHESLPVILLTADEPESLIHDAFDAGATDLFPESIIEVSYDPLINRIKEVVRDGADGETKPASSGQSTAPSTERSRGPLTRDAGFAFNVVSPDREPEPQPKPRAEPSTSPDTSDTPTDTPDTDAGPTAKDEAAADTAEAAEEAAASSSTDESAATDGESKLDELGIDLSRLKELPREELLALLNIDDDPDAPPAVTKPDPTAESTEPTSPSPTAGTASPAAVDTPTEPAADTASEAEPTSDRDADAESDDATPVPYSRPAGLDLTPGTTLLVECRSQDSRKHDANRDLLGLDDDSGRNVLLIRYRTMSPSQLESIATDANNVKIITVGCDQPIPDGVSDTIETIHINNPNDVRRLGILATGVANDWGPLDTGLSVSLDPMDILFNYKTVEAVFRFFHIFLGKLSSQGAVTQFHLDPTSTGEQNSNTIKPLFDHIITIDDHGVALDGSY